MFSILENIETYFGYFLIRFYWHKVSYCTTQKRQVFQRISVVAFFKEIFPIVNSTDLTWRQLYFLTWWRHSRIFLDAAASYKSIRTKKAQRVRRLRVHIMLLIYSFTKTVSNFSIQKLSLWRRLSLKISLSRFVFVNLSNIVNLACSRNLWPLFESVYLLILLWGLSRFFGDYSITEKTWKTSKQ